LLAVGALSCLAISERKRAPTAPAPESAVSEPVTPAA
jgi:hypothetical protein